MSRSVRHEPFTLTREIEADSGNPACWRSARLTYLASHQVAEHSADALVISLLEEHGSLNSTGLRRHAKGSGFSGQAISEAVKRLYDADRIAYDPGPRNARNWRLTRPQDPGQGGQATLPNLSDPDGQGGANSVHPAS